MRHSLATVTRSFKKLGSFLSAHSFMVYFIIFTFVLTGAFLGLNIALNQPSDEDYRSQKLSEIQSTKFDTATIERIKRLNAQQQTNLDTLPAGQRTNPFSE